MKKLTILAYALLLSLAATAQTEIKVNPIGLLYGDLIASAEFGLGEDFGIEPFIGAFTGKVNVNSREWKASSGQIGALGKYYFNPKHRIDRFFLGAYLRANKGDFKSDGDVVKFDRTAFGFYLGYKWVNRKGFVVELGGGLGRAFVNKFERNNVSYDELLREGDAMARFSIGFRLGGRDK